MVTPGQLTRRAAFFEQLAAMIAAGVPLTKAMEMAGRNRSLGVPQRVVQAISQHLLEGHTFSDAMQLVSGQKQSGLDVSLKRGNREYWLADFDVALLSAGEESGRLDSAFKLLARYYTSRAKIIRDTISNSIITLVTLHVFLLVFPIGLLQSFAMGIKDSQYSQCLPFIIEKIAVFGALYGLAGGLIFASQDSRSEGWRAAVESFFNGIPMLGTAVKYLAVARLSMALNALLSAGVPMIRSWELAGVACGSPRFKREIINWRPSFEASSTPADLVTQTRYFPEIFANLYHSGEISGKLDEALTHLQSYFEEEGFRKLQAFCRILNFVIYFGIAIMIAIFIIGFWTSYFNSITSSF